MEGVVCKRSNSVPIFLLSNRITYCLYLLLLHTSERGQFGWQMLFNARVVCSVYAPSFLNSCFCNQIVVQTTPWNLEMWSNVESVATAFSTKSEPDAVSFTKLHNPCFSLEMTLGNYPLFTSLLASHGQVRTKQCFTDATFVWTRGNCCIRAYPSFIQQNITKCM